MKQIVKGNWILIVFVGAVSLLALYVGITYPPGSQPVKVWTPTVIEGNSTLTMKNTTSGEAVTFTIKFNGLRQIDRVDMDGSSTDYWAPDFSFPNSWFKYWYPFVGVKFETHYLYDRVEVSYTDEWQIVQLVKAP